MEDWVNAHDNIDFGDYDEEDDSDESSQSEVNANDNMEAAHDFDFLDYSDEEDSSDEEDVVPLEMYPEAKLVSFELKDSSAAAEQEVRELEVMKLKDDTFKIKLRTDAFLGYAFGMVLACTGGPKHFTSDSSKRTLQEIENALVHRLLFAVRQRRLVTKLENKGLLANSALAWKDATSALDEASKIVFIWHTERLLPLSEALLRELNCVMTNEDFDDGLRHLLTQELKRELFWT
jgi:hypothetical protein